jgi:hypothetical protein
MKEFLIYICLTGLVFFSYCEFAFADNDETKVYLSEKINLKPFNANQWNGLTDGLKYNQLPKTRKIKKQNPSEDSQNNFSPDPLIDPITFKEFAQFVLILLAVFLLAFVVYKAVVGDTILINNKIQRTKSPTTLKEIETNLHEADVESFLEKALNEKKYRLAIRLYYLAIIKELSVKSAIVWKKDKTNGHYLRELRSHKHPKLKEFSNVTRIFEYVWYSDMDFDGGQFQEVRIDFKELLTAIK